MRIGGPVRRSREARPLRAAGNVRSGGSPRRTLRRTQQRALQFVVPLLVLGVLSGSCRGTGLFRQYEYEEEMYLSLDGSATVYVNSSIAALNALRGTSFDATSGGRFDRDVYRAYFTSPDTHVTRVTSSRRSGRRFVHVRLDVDDVRRMAEAAPFAWSTYHLDRDGDQFIYRQDVGAAAGGDAGATRWSGQELVAFRMHLPSKIDFHNTPTHEVGRGNILVWEQRLADRLHGAPIALEARIQTQSILYRTLWLFGITFVVVAVVFAAVIWWILKRGKPSPHVIQQS
jgi:hypothetical protein